MNNTGDTLTLEELKVGDILEVRYKKEYLSHWHGSKFKVLKLFNTQFRGECIEGFKIGHVEDLEIQVSDHYWVRVPGEWDA